MCVYAKYTVLTAFPNFEEISFSLISLYTIEPVIRMQQQIRHRVDVKMFYKRSMHFCITHCVNNYVPTVRSALILRQLIPMNVKYCTETCVTV